MFQGRVKRISVKLTQESVAEMLGTSRATEFRREGVKTKGLIQ